MNRNRRIVNAEEDPVASTALTEVEKIKETLNGMQKWMVSID